MENSDNTIQDRELDVVVGFFHRIPDFSRRVGLALRQAFDEVIDTERTGRWDINDLEKTEKTYIGTKVEIVFRNEFSLGRGEVLDNLIDGQEVDTKFSLTGGWMIPSEAIGRICLLVAGNDDSGRFQVGLIRAVPQNLTTGTNQDGKRSISKEGKTNIFWLVKNEALPRNFFLDLDNEVRRNIFDQPDAKKRIQMLFRLVKGQIIPRSVIAAVGRGTKDPLKRAREAKEVLLKEGLLVLCANYQEDRQKMQELGFTDPDASEWLSVPVRDVAP